VVEFGWHHSIARPHKPRVGRKDLLDISYTHRVIADFVSNFVAMATWVLLKFVWHQWIAWCQKPLLVLDATISEISLIQA